MGAMAGEGRGGGACAAKRASTFWVASYFFLPCMASGIRAVRFFGWGTAGIIIIVIIAAWGDGQLVPEPGGF